MVKIMQDIMKKYNHLEKTAPAILKPELIRKCIEDGLDEGLILEQIEALKREGEIYEAMEGVLKRL